VKARFYIIAVMVTIVLSSALVIGCTLWLVGA
jgi:hypothetical protein